MHRTIKIIVILKPKSATAGFETGTAGMQNSNSMSDRLSITPRSYSHEGDTFGVDILGATLFCVGRCETFHAATWLLRRVLSTDDTTQAVKATRRQISVWRNTLLAHGLDLKRH